MRIIAKLLVVIVFGATAARGVIDTAATQPSTRPAVHVYHGVEVELHVHENQYISRSVDYWKREAQRRFIAPILIFGHGNDFNGVWSMQLQDQGNRIVPVAEVAAKVRAKFPDRVIVLICCNPKGHALHMPGVYHAWDSVWFVPDKEITNVPSDQKEHNQDRNVVGNVFEFSDD